MSSTMAFSCVIAILRFLIFFKFDGFVVDEILSELIVAYYVDCSSSKQINISKTCKSRDNDGPISLLPDADLHHISKINNSFDYFA